MADCAIDVWVWPLDIGADERVQLASLLSEDETARAQRFVFVRDRERFVVGRGRLRQILGARTGVRAAALRFDYSEHNKPTLAGLGAPLHFNLSHSEGLAALAVADAFELGVDIQAVRPLKENIAARFFSPCELAELDALPEAERLDGFYRCWTRKEAILKALGDGMARPLDSFDVSISTPARLLRLDGEPNAPATWQIVHFDPGHGFQGAVACRTGGRRIELTRKRL